MKTNRSPHHYIFLLTFALAHIGGVSFSPSYGMGPWEIIKKAVFKPAYNPDAGDQVCENFRKLWHEINDIETHPSLQGTHQQVRTLVHSGLQICNARKKALIKRQKSQLVGMGGFLSALLYGPQHALYKEGEKKLAEGDRLLDDIHENIQKHIAALQEVTHFHQENDFTAIDLTPQQTPFIESTKPCDSSPSIESTGAPSITPITPITPITQETGVSPIKDNVLPTIEELTYNPKPGNDMCDDFVALSRKMSSLRLSRKLIQPIEEEISDGIEFCNYRSRAVTEMTSCQVPPFPSSDWVNHLKSGIYLTAADANMAQFHEKVKCRIDNLIIIKNHGSPDFQSCKEKSYDPAPGDAACLGYKQMQKEMASLIAFPRTINARQQLTSALKHAITQCDARQAAVSRYRTTQNEDLGSSLKQKDESLRLAYKLAVIDFMAFKANNENQG